MTGNANNSHRSTIHHVARLATGGRSVRRILYLDIHMRFQNSDLTISKSRWTIHNEPDFVKTFSGGFEKITTKLPTYE